MQPFARIEKKTLTAMINVFFSAALQLTHANCRFRK